MSSLPSQPSADESTASGALVARDLGNGLFVVYILEESGQSRYARESDLSGARMTRIDLHYCSIQNVVDTARRKPVDVVRYDSAFVVLWEGWYEASLILAKEIWDGSFKELVPGGFIAAIPRQDVLAFCDAQSASGLAKLREISIRAFGGELAIATTLFRRQGFSWLRHPD
jgi:uncharacterized protein YtpQ (UPF0354 family)